MSTSSAPQPIDQSIAQVYKAFKRHRPPKHTLDVCLHCCVSAKVEKELRTLPLRQIPARHFYDYNTSAATDVQYAPEIGYLLPRMFELMAEGEEIHHSTECYLTRLGACAPDVWSKEEVDAINAFALSYFDLVIRAQPPSGHRRFLKEEPFDTLLMFHKGKVDLAPLLAHWLACPAPEAAASFVLDTYFNFWEDLYYANPFAEDLPDFRQRVHDWIMSPEVRATMQQKLMAPDFEAWMQMSAPETDNVDFEVMVWTALDHLSR